MSKQRPRPRGVTVDSGPPAQELPSRETPRVRWPELVRLRRDFLQVNLAFDCRCLVMFVREADEMWEELGYADRDDLLARGYGIDPGEVEPAVLAALGARSASSLTPVLNATGVVVHTNLGRAPLSAAALDALRQFRNAAAGEMPLIGCGGIASAEDAWERIRAGASLVQLYSAMVYDGPGIARRIASGLERKLEQSGFASIAEAVGSE